MPATKIAGYGWKKDSLDHRDLLLATPSAAAETFPARFSLESKFDAPYDQGQEGSCTGNSSAAALDFERFLQGLPRIQPSRNFIYYNARALEGTTGVDAGAQLRDAIKGIASLGACPESEWPYIVSQFATKPSLKAYQDALKSRALTYSRVSQTLYGIKHCLSTLGRPFVFGFSVFEAFESQQVALTGIVPMPKPTEAPIGGHAVLAVGWDDVTRRVRVRNSWGAKWGQGGYFEIPYDYLLNPQLASDFWVIQSVAA